jgi:hypothetical protein
MEVYAAYAGANRGPIARITSRSSPAGHVVEVEVAVAVSLFTRSQQTWLVV